MHIQRMLRNVLAAVVLACSGCATDLPVASSDGSLRGGSERLRSILDIARRETMTRQQQAFSVVFIGEPYSNAIVRGTLDAANGLPAMEYQIVVPVEGADRAHQAVVMIPSEQVGQPATALLYRWEHTQWQPLSGVPLSPVR